MKSQPDNFTHMLVADDTGTIYEHPQLMAAACTGNEFVPAERCDFPTLRSGGQLVSLPGRKAAGFDPDTNRLETVDSIRLNGRSIRCSAVAAIAPPGDTRLFLPAYETTKGAPVLPLFAYCAAGWRNGKHVAAAIRTDFRRHWDCCYYNKPDLARRIAAMCRRHPRNAILRQLALCSRAYSCCTAQNIFYRRWEGGIPVSPACNARCLGCISKQEGGCKPPPAQFRIEQAPDVRDIVALATDHLSHAERPTVSFGQGCEGEPTLQCVLIAEAIRLIRGKTGRGLLHMNTNGGRTDAISMLADSGLQSVRIAINSAIPKTHKAYFRPAGFGLTDAEASMRTAAAKGLRVSVNLLVMPGLTDRSDETEALIALLRRTEVHCLQLRNLCIDPELYFRTTGRSGAPLLGIRAMLDRIRQELPGLEIGCFNPLPRS